MVALIEDRLMRNTCAHAGTATSFLRGEGAGGDCGLAVKPKTFSTKRRGRKTDVHVGGAGWFAGTLAEAEMEAAFAARVVASGVLQLLEGILSDTT